MNCIKEKRFLFWKYKVVKHDFKMSHIYKFMRSSEHFRVGYRCACGQGMIKHFVTNDELLLKGIPQDVLNGITDTKWHYIN